MFPGGFSAGDEPEGSAKFFATAFQNEKIKEAVTKLLQERDGLALGICNGFQALIKLGLVPGGEITGQKEDSPTPVSYTHLFFCPESVPEGREAFFCPDPAPEGREAFC